MTHYLSDFLVQMAKEYQIESYMEIGVNEGRSLTAVVKNAPKLKTLYVCDNWTGWHGGKSWGNHKHITQKINASGYKGDVIYLDGDSQKTIPQYHKSHPEMVVDLVTVDGNHDTNPAWEDLTNVERFAKIIVFDDVYHPGHPNLADLWQVFIKRLKKANLLKDYRTYTDGNGFGWVILKRAKG